MVGLESVYGFGSFFRGGKFNDIDLVAITTPSNRDTLSTYYALADAIAKVSENLRVKFHLTMLTPDELLQSPFRDMHEMQLLTEKSALWEAKPKSGL